METSRDHQPLGKLKVGQDLGHYQILGQLGEGGMGVVYSARDLRLGRTVVLKVLHPKFARDAERLERFRREARIVAALSHPNIVTLHSFEHEGDRHFLTMECIEGKTLTHEIGKEGMSQERFFNLAIPLTEALSAAHRQNVVHRDLKPGNVMVTPNGHVTVLDFGIARLSTDAGALRKEAVTVTLEEGISTKLTLPGAVLGTISYMSPEQAQGLAIDERSDVFSLGVLFYEMLSGKRPFHTSNPMQTLVAIMHDPSPNLREIQPGLSEDLVRVIECCLQKDPGQRFSDAGGLLEALSQVRKKVTPTLSALGLDTAARKKAKQVHSIPFLSLEDQFKGREEALEALASEDAKLQILCGLGGMGKTRLAVEYAWQNLDRFTSVFWVSASGTAQLRSGLAELAGRSLLDLLEKEAEDEDLVIDAVLAALREFDEWLLVFDNVDDLETATLLRSYFPQLIHGTILITSRLSDWPEGRSHLLDTIPLEAAEDLLMERGGGLRADATRLAEHLGCLPLALDQAGAYMTRRRQTVSEYLQDWERDRKKVLAWYKKGAMEYPASVAVTWSHTFEDLDAGAQVLLQMASFLAPDPIPVDLVVRSEEILTEAMHRLCQKEGEDGASGEDLDVRDALADLASCSMIAWDGETFQVHRLVQEVTRGRIAEAQRGDWVLWVLRALSDFAPKDAMDMRTWPIWEPLRPHIERIFTFSKDLDDPSPTSTLLGRYGLLLSGKGRFSEAEPFLRRALRVTEERYGKSHPEVSKALGNLSSALYGLKRFEEATSGLQRSLTISEENYEADHPEIALSMIDLATLYEAMDHRAEAEPLIRRSLEINEHNYGENHPEVSRGLNVLGRLLHTTGRLDEAEPLLRRAVSIDCEVYGSEHPVYAIRLNNLALLLKATERVDEAKPLFLEALDILRKIMGDQHPWTQKVIQNIDNL